MEIISNKLIREFGCEQLIASDIARIYSLPNHTSNIPSDQKLLQHLYNSHMLVSHRDLHSLLDSYRDGQPFYIYTGRGPSSGSLHIGHLIPFIVAKHLQDIFDVPVFIQLSTDEKYLRDGLSLEEVESMAYNNAIDIMSLGFNPNKTIILSNFESIRQLYPTVMDILRHTTINQMMGIFGKTPNIDTTSDINVSSSNAGNYYFPAVEAAPSFPTSLKGIIEDHPRCLVVLGLDQDPYFRLARDVANRLKCYKPALLHTTFVPSLSGIESKMSSSDPSTAIFLSDTSKQITTKINKKAFSGGQPTIELHRKLGGNINVDVCCRYLQIFSGLSSLNIDIDSILYNYKEGILLTGELKKLTIDMLNDIIIKYRSNRPSDGDIRKIMTIRKIS